MKQISNMLLTAIPPFPYLSPHTPPSFDFRFFCSVNFVIFLFVKKLKVKSTRHESIIDSYYCIEKREKSVQFT